jgi:tetratricopeptide (TPR) repeat protein
VDLSQSPTIRLIDQQGMADALARMQRPAGVTITPSLGRELAERIGVKAVVTGQIDPVGSGYVLPASLVSAGDGRVLVAVRESAEQGSALLPAIDRLSKKLRERIGESLTTIRADPALAQVTTSSLDALRRYSQAMRLEDEGRMDEAIPLLEEAVALDSGFAMAWRKLAVNLGNLQAPPSRQVAAATAAYRHRERLPSLERDLATGYYFSFVEDDPARVAAAYRSALETDPDNQAALNNLSIVLSQQDRLAEAESLLVRANRAAPIISSTQNLINTQVLQGHLADAEATARAYRAARPSSWFADGAEALVASIRRDLSTSERLLTRVRQANRDQPLLYRRLTEFLAGEYEKEGRIAQARDLYRELESDAEQTSKGPEALEFACRIALLSVRYAERPADALVPLGEAIRRHPLDRMDPLDRPYEVLIHVYALAGRPDEGRRLQREYEASVPGSIRRIRASLFSSAGALAEAEGRDDVALAAYRELHRRSGDCGTCGLFQMARIYDRRGQADSALAAYAGVVTHTSLLAAFRVERLTLAPSLKRLGELYEARQDRKKAADYYGRFVDLYQHADPELQPAVREVRARLGRLAQEPGT